MKQLKAVEEENYRTSLTFHYVSCKNFTLVRWLNPQEKSFEGQVETSILPDQEKYALVALESSSELDTKLEENLNQMFPVNLTKRRWKLPFN